MTGRPILFSAPMVRALLDGRKTQMRRILKGVPDAPGDDCVVHPNPKHEHAYFDAYCGGKRTELNPRGMTDHWCWWTRDDRAGHGCKVGYVPGDRLWVKETWRAGRGYDGASIRSIAPWSRIWFEADECNDNADAIGRTARPSIFMPRWASRLTLIVTDVRVQRLQDCSEEDALAEGIVRLQFPETGDWGWPQRKYAELWDSINSEPGKRWADNPWIVAVTFTVEQRNIDKVVS